MQEILDPLGEYTAVFRDRFKEVCERTFASLANEAHVDVAKNHETCTQIYESQNQLDQAKRTRTRWTVLCVLLWLMAAGCLGVAIASFTDASFIDPIVVVVAVAFAAVVLVWFLFVKVHPMLRYLKTLEKTIAEKIATFTNEAWAQMAPLNSLYDWDLLPRMMTETVPMIQFDPYFTQQRLDDLASYGWTGDFNSDRSVLYSHSGLINGNPFVLCRTRRMNMETKTYYGSKTITWTTTERGSDGKFRSVTHSQVLTASVTEPFPVYYEKTRLFYANEAAPDLTFTRKHSGLAGKEESLKYKWKRYRIKNKSRNMKCDFAMLTNEDFEVIFDTRNRNNNQQHALLFTPLAQENMTKLMLDDEDGYGDDFDFEKDHKLNTIVAEHLQGIELDCNPNRYRSFDFENAKSQFCTINSELFRAIYFAIAPLLCIEPYQYFRPVKKIYGYEDQAHSTFWEHEAMANFFGQDNFKHPACVTDNILKTQADMGADGHSQITVHAYGYTAEPRISYISKLGGDGNMHQVPVHWDEYLPVIGTGRIAMKEDYADNTAPMTQQERLARINDLLSASGLSLYRRHIASKVSS